MSSKLITLSKWLRSNGFADESNFAIRLYKIAAEGYRDEGLVGKYWGSAASGILITDGKRILLLKRSSDVLDPNIWGISGGAIPVDEDGNYKDARESAIQEAEEEMDSLPDGEFIDSFEFRDEDFMYTTFLMKTSPEELDNFSPVLNWEHTDWTIKEIDKIGDIEVHPGVVKALAHFGRKDKKENLSIAGLDLPQYVYHGSKSPPATMMDVFLSKSFKMKRSTLGNGFYSIYDISSPAYTLGGTYGDYIYKLKADFSNFLILDPDLIGREEAFKEMVLGQLAEKFGDDIFSDEELLNIIGKNPSSTIGLWLHIHDEYDVYGEFSGVAMTGAEYGKIALIFNPNSLVPISFDTIGGLGDGWKALDLPEDIGRDDSRAYVAEQYAKIYPALFFEEGFDTEFPDLKDAAVSALLNISPIKFFELELYKRPHILGDGMVGEEEARGIAEEDPEYFLKKGLGSYYVKLDLVAAKALKRLNPEALYSKYEYLVQTYGSLLE